MTLLIDPRKKLQTVDNPFARATVVPTVATPPPALTRTPFASLQTRSALPPQPTPSPAPYVRPTPQVAPSSQSTTPYTPPTGPPVLGARPWDTEASQQSSSYSPGPPVPSVSPPTETTQIVQPPRGLPGGGVEGEGTNFQIEDLNPQTQVLETQAGQAGTQTGAGVGGQGGGVDLTGAVVSPDNNAANGGIGDTTLPITGGEVVDDIRRFGDTNDELIDQLIREGLQGGTFRDVTLGADPFRDVTLDADPFRDVTLDSKYDDVRIRGDPFRKVTMGGDPFKKVSIDYTGDPEIDALLREHTKQLLSERGGDTSEEEALINQRIKDQLGQSLVGQRASMGRAGFGSSGALSALEGDTTRLANQDALEQILAMREREQEQAFRHGQAGADTAMRRDEQMYGRATDLADLDFENQAAAHERAREQAALDFQNQEFGYERATDQAKLDAQNQAERYRRAQDQADLSFRNQETGYGRVQDQAALDRQNQADAYERAQDQMNLAFRNQETGFGQRMASANLNTRQQQAENEAALLKATLDAFDELTQDNETAPHDTDNDGIQDDQPNDVGDAANSGIYDVFGTDPPPDADTYAEWNGNGNPTGIPTGQDDDYVYVVGLDGRHWKVRKNG